MLLNFIDTIGMFDKPAVQVLVVLGIAAVADGVRLTLGKARPDAPDGGVGGPSDVARSPATLTQTA